MARSQEFDAWLERLKGHHARMYGGVQSAAVHEIDQAEQEPETPTCPDKMMLADFLKSHGGNMAACPDTLLGVEFPERPAATDMEKAGLKGVVTFITGVLGVAFFKNPTLAKGIAGVAGSMAVEWITKHLPGPIPAHVEWIKVRDLIGSE